MIRSMRDFLSLPLKNLEKKCQDTCFYSVIWSLWKARNDLNFNNAVTEWELTTTDLAKIRVALWIKGLNNITDYSVEDFKGNHEAIRRMTVFVVPQIVPCFFHCIFILSLSSSFQYSMFWASNSSLGLVFFSFFYCGPSWLQFSFLLFSRCTLSSFIKSLFFC